MKPGSKTRQAMRRDAQAIFQAGLAAVDPITSIHRHCRLEKGRLMIGAQRFDLARLKRIMVIGAGKASAAMAQAMESIIGDRIDGGIVITKYGHGTALHKLKIIEAGHPIPDECGVLGAETMIEIAQRARSGDLVICLISGGGSALLPLPHPGLSLSDKQATTNALLACGATIHEINAIRKHLSAIKGGRLAAAASPAAVAALILSDVVGDDLDVIASGPTVPDSSTFAQCQAIIEAYGLADKIPVTVSKHILRGVAGGLPETPKPQHAIFSRVNNTIIGNNMDAIRAARLQAEALGYRSVVLSSMIEGETRHVATVHGAIAAEILKTGHPVPAPACILSGGETTVTLQGQGKGGRNQEFALAAAMAIAGRAQIVVLSGGTDGSDGLTDAAGAIADDTTTGTAKAMGLDPRHFLSANDAYHFFAKLKDLLMTGPTRTNVMDLHILLVCPDR